MTHPLAEESNIFEQLINLNKQLGLKFEKCMGISPSKLRLLYELYQVDEISQTTLQKKVDIDNAAVTRHLKQLELSGMVGRRMNPTDNRVTLVCLTDHGRKEIISLREEKTQFITRMLKDFNEQERDALCNMLKRMLNNIGY
ncbi:MarR family transcriptional regulator [Paenibacillus oenotherae]|uniref:MarR family transcriptional regulator n=1 Tax=Paenibacillus oenotherae TaxID=1435645 RepID=A0ABS7D1S4_9BACL|nr:MarR family transcriptional regulator [Paenibacillus oenotherae]MBW7473138.1 MarR family transcriptional regulator [Paenibacillus oenotherae]